MEYDIHTIIERLSEPDKLIDPNEITILQGYLNGHITDLEEETWGLQLIASNKKLELLGSANLTNAHAKAMWEVSQEFINWRMKENLIKRLKRYRSDLKERLQVLTGQQRRY